MSPALIVALLSAAFYGTADFFGGLAARRAPALAATVVAQALGLVLVAIALPLFPAGRPSAVSALWAVGAGVTGGTGVALLYYGLRVQSLGLACAAAAIVLITSR